MFTAEEIGKLMLGLKNGQKAEELSRFFKTGKGQYGEGDRFIGINVPKVRAVVKEIRHRVPLGEMEKLLHSEWHEIRLLALLLIVEEVKSTLPSKSVPEGNPFLRERIVRFYIKHAKQANNWDLVDLSCEYVIGTWLLYPAQDGTCPDRSILDSLADSGNLWEQRISIVSTLTLIRAGQFDDTIRIAGKLLNHSHDLIQKAVGWMLREVGKKDLRTLRGFLEAHHKEMARTTLRYAIEKMDCEERLFWLKR